MKYVICFLLMISAVLSGFKPFVFAQDEFVENDSPSHIEEVFENYQIFDQNNVFITERASVGLGDFVIDLDFNEYEIILVDDVNFIAKAEFRRKLERPKVRRKEISDVNTIVSTKKIGLYSTHNDESYITGDGTESVYGKGGIHDIGNLLASKLGERSVVTTYDETLHIPHDSKAYNRSRNTAKSLLDDGNTAIFDIHRDATSRNFYLTSNNGRNLSKVRIVVGQSNPNKDVNLQFALWLVSVANTLYPWMIADIYYGSGRYNQDLSSKALLFEMGCHNIEKEYVERTIPYLADVIYTTLFATTVDQENDELTIGGATNTNPNAIVDNVLEDYNKQSNWVVWLIVATIGTAILASIFALNRRKKQ